jgi:hypothetical protein
VNRFTAYRRRSVYHVPQHRELDPKKVGTLNVRKKSVGRVCTVAPLPILRAALVGITFSRVPAKQDSFFGVF